MRRLLRTATLLSFLPACTGRDPLGDTADTTAATTAGTTTSATGITTTTAPPTTGDATTLVPTTGADTTTTTGETTFCPNSCSEFLVDYPIAPVDLVFVIDKANTMSKFVDPDDLPIADGTWDHDGDPATPEITNWESMHRVVEWTATTFDASLRAGLSLYPARNTVSGDSPADSCKMDLELEVPLASHNGEAIVGALPDPSGDAVDGGLPASLAIARSVDALAAGDPNHSRHIVFVSDAPANCAGDTPTEAFETYDATLHARVIAALADHAIVTHVVGIEIPDATTGALEDGQPDDTNNFARLNELAVQGGAPRPAPERFFNAWTEEQLRAAFEAIVRSTLSCTLVLDPPPMFPDKLEVQVAAVNYGNLPVTDCAAEDGWRYLEPGMSIELCGAACRDFQTAGTLRALYRGCLDNCN